MTNLAVCSQAASAYQSVYTGEALISQSTHFQSPHNVLHFPSSFCQLLALLSRAFFGEQDFYSWDRYMYTITSNEYALILDARYFLWPMYPDHDVIITHSLFIMHHGV